MKRIPFNLDYWIGHHPMLETREGKKARIVAIDAKGDFPIAGLVELFKGIELTFSYTEEGKSYPTHESDTDLIMLIH